MSPGVQSFHFVTFLGHIEAVRIAVSENELSTDRALDAYLPSLLFCTQVDRSRGDPAISGISKNGENHVSSLLIAIDGIQLISGGSGG